MANCKLALNSPKYKALTHERLLERVDYDPDTGVFSWRPRNGRMGSAIAGAPAGSSNKDGYIALGISLDGKRYIFRAHRLAIFYMTKQWPTDQVDHENLIKNDNRYSNLRDANYSLNAQNRKVSARSSTGIKGIYWNNFAKKWSARIYLQGKPKHLGSFGTQEEASSAYAEAAKKYYGEFARAA